MQSPAGVRPETGPLRPHSVHSPTGRRRSGLPLGAVIAAVVGVELLVVFAVGLGALGLSL